MNWVFRSFSTSLGKKQIMAVTGLGFLGFVAGHLAGNLAVYGGPEAFNAYAERLHSLEPLVKAAEAALLLFAIAHVCTGLVLFYQNLTARPVRYKVPLRAGGRTLSSALMPYTGLYMLVFIAVHLAAFHFTPHEPSQTFSLVAGVFSSPYYVGFYMLSMAVLALHVRHGLWSAFQTMGLNHPKYMPGIEKLSWIYAAAVLAGFGFLPLAIMLMAKGGY